MNFEVVVICERDGDSYHVFCPALKGLHTYGATVKEAKKNAEEAVLVYLMSAKKHNDPIPLGCVKHSKEECLREAKRPKAQEMVLRPCLQC